MGFRAGPRVELNLGMMAWLPLIALAAGAAGAPCEAPCEVVMSARVAQVRLARTLAGADAIESVTVTREGLGRAGAVGPATVTFSVVRDGELLQVSATTARNGEVAALVIMPAGPASAELHRLTWLAAELADASAVVRLADADRDGVLLSTSDGRRYLVAPPRGPRTGNEAVEARWGAAWTDAGA
jgi:hypothetical protein